VDARIVVLTYYNILPACNLAWLAPVAELALEADGAVVPGLNNLIRQISAFRHVFVAQGYGRLSSNSFVGGDDCRHPNSADHARLAARRCVHGGRIVLRVSTPKATARDQRTLEGNNCREWFISNQHLVTR